MTLRHQTHAVPAATHGGRFIVVHRVPQLPGEPEYCVVEDGFRGDSVGIFWNEKDAYEYIEWRNKAVGKDKDQA